MLEWTSWLLLLPIPSEQVPVCFILSRFSTLLSTYYCGYEVSQVTPVSDPGAPGEHEEGNPQPHVQQEVGSSGDLGASTRDLTPRYLLDMCQLHIAG